MNTWEIIGLSFMAVTTAFTWGLALAWTIERLATGRWWWSATTQRCSSQTTYTIKAVDPAEAFLTGQRQERQRAAAKLPRL